MSTAVNDRRAAEAFQYLGPLVSLIFVVFLILVLEIVATLFSPPKNRLETILAVLEQDSGLFWKQKSRLDTIFDDVRVQTNRLGLRNQEVPAHKNANMFRIVCLGASPTFGWGVSEDQTYSRRLERLLRHKPGGTADVEVINAGVIGYSSHQGLRLFREKIAALSPDIITVSYVINDVDKYRFYRSNGLSDRELPDKNVILVKLENLLDKSRAVRLLRKFIAGHQSAAVKNFGRSGTGRYNEKRRVSPEDYRANLKAIIHAARERGIRVVLVKMPVNLPAAGDVPDDLKARADQAVENAVSLAGAGQYQQAVVELEAAVRDNPYLSKAFFYLGQYSQRLNRLDAAERYFKEAVKMELFECEKLGKVYNEIMAATAAEEQVVLVDVVSEFDAYRETHPEPLFLEYKHDTIHPNRVGHEIISRAIARALINNSLFPGENPRI